MSEETDKNKRILLATKLANGTATQQERDAALAELLLTLWDTETLNAHIDERIDAKCKVCDKTKRSPEDLDVLMTQWRV